MVGPRGPRGFLLPSWSRQQEMLFFSSLVCLHPFPFLLPSHGGFSLESNLFRQLPWTWLGWHLPLCLQLPSLLHQKVTLAFCQTSHCPLCHHHPLLSPVPAPLHPCFPASSVVQSIHFWVYRWMDLSGVLVCCAEVLFFPQLWISN